jgi:hypothetical protein
VRVVEVVAVAAFLAGSLAIGRAAWRAAVGGRRGHAQAGAWEAYHRFEGSGRRVYVRRGGELEPIGEVASSDADYDMAFLALMDRARERAAVLNSELGG